MGAPRPEVMKLIGGPLDGQTAFCPFSEFIQIPRVIDGRTMLIRYAHVGGNQFVYTGAKHIPPYPGGQN